MNFAFIIGGHEPSTWVLRILQVPPMADEWQNKTDRRGWANWWYMNVYDQYHMLHGSVELGPDPKIQVDSGLGLNISVIERSAVEEVINLARRAES